jgi:hypothetical protein
MKWQVEFGPAFMNYDIASFRIYAALLAEGIESGLADLNNLQLFGKFCDACGQFRMTESLDVDGGRELLAYDVCSECRDEMQDRGHNHTCQQCDKVIVEECHCPKGNTYNMWCSSNCRAAYDL